MKENNDYDYGYDRASFPTSNIVNTTNISQSVTTLLDEWRILSEGRWISRSSKLIDRSEGKLEAPREYYWDYL